MFGLISRPGSSTAARPRRSKRPRPPRQQQRRWGPTSRRSNRPTANTVLVVDASHSMAGQLACPSGKRITKRDAAVEAAVLLVQHKIKNCPQDLLGCVGFGSKPFVVSPLTRPSHPKIVERLKALRLSGTTDMKGGLKLAMSLLTRRPGHFLRNMVLISDGYPDERSGLKKLARRAKDSRINLHTIGVGDPADFDETLLRLLSSLTHRGQYRHVASLQELATALQAMA